MNLGAFATATDEEVTTWMHIRNLNNELAYSEDEQGNPDKTKPVRVKLRGKDSSAYKREVAKQLRAAQMENQKSRGKYIKPFSEMEADNRRLLAVTTMGFENLSQADGTALTADDAEHVYKVAPHIAEQVSQFLEDRANFLPGSLAA